MVVRGRVIRVTAVVAGVLVTAGAAAASVLVIRRRRGGPVTIAARRLPQATHGAVVPAARATERWASRRAERARNKRDEMMQQVSAAIADNQAEAERRANPVWRRAAVKGVETAATVGAAALVRRAFNEPIARGSKAAGPLSAPENDLLVSGHGEETGATDGVAADAERAPSRAVRGS
jgi:hypothetical protein